MCADTRKICACAPSLKPLLHQPILNFTSLLSSKFSRISSNRSPMTSRSRTPKQSSSGAKSSKTSPLKIPFIRHGILPSAQDSVWDGDEEYGMLPQRLAHGEKDGSVTVSATRGDTDRDRAWPIREPPTLGEAGRKPTLEIMKSSCVDQEVSYISTGSKESSTKDEATRSNEESDR